ncbi:MAG: hypothetical protein WCG28_02770, partial [bacterium]
VVVDVFADVGNSPNVSVVNVNSPTITPVATLANGAGTAASQTVDIAGTAATGQANPTITIGGYPTGVVQLSGDTAIVMAGKFVTAINANTNVNGQWVASNGGTATVTVRSRTVGTGPNGTLISAANGGTGTTAGVTGGATTILGGLAAPAQIETYTVGADIVAGNVYSITLNGIASTHTAVTGDTVTTVGDALRTAINANVTAVTATGTTTVIVTANTAGTAFTVGASTAVVGSRTTGGAIATKLSMTATGTTSNSTVTSSPTSQLGQTVTTTAGVLTPSTLVTTSSPTAQLVIGGSNLALATYHFVATNGAATIDELTFKVTTSGSSSAPIGNVTVNEVSSSPTYTTINNCTSDATHMCVDLNGLGIVVPVGSAGLDVPVTVAFNSVGTGNQTSGNTAIITLQDVYSKFGSTNVHTTTPNPASKTMTTVASKPTVTVSAPVNGVSALGVGYIEAIDVKVAADAAGPITMNSFTITSTPSSAVAFDALKATVYDVGGAEIATDAGSACAGGAGVACAVTVTLTGGRTIAAGTSETYRVFLSVNTLGATVSPNATINTKLTSAAGFNWTDTAGAGTATDGSAIYAFPATTLTVHN